MRKRTGIKVDAISWHEAIESEDASFNRDVNAARGKAARLCRFFRCGQWQWGAAQPGPGTGDRADRGNGGVSRRAIGLSARFPSARACGLADLTPEQVGRRKGIPVSGTSTHQGVISHTLRCRECGSGHSGCTLAPPHHPPKKPDQRPAETCGHQQPGHGHEHRFSICSALGRRYGGHALHHGARHHSRQTDQHQHLLRFHLRLPFLCH